MSFRVDDCGGDSGEEPGDAGSFGVDVGFDVMVTAGGELVERGGFAGEHLVNDGVERAGGDQCGDGDGAGLCNAVDAVFGLGDERGSPLGFHEKRVLGAREGETDSSSGDLCDEHVYLARLEVGHGGVAFGLAGCPVVGAHCGMWEHVGELVGQLVDDLCVDTPGDERAASPLNVGGNPICGWVDFEDAGGVPHL